MKQSYIFSFRNHSGALHPLHRSLFLADIIFFLFELLPLAFLITLPGINSFSFVISVKVFVSSAFLKDVFPEHRLLEFQYFPDVALPSSCSHC